MSERLFTNLPLEVCEGFNDLHTMTIKELEKEYKKNLKKIEGLKDEKAGSTGCPTFSIDEQITELERYGKTIKAQLKELHDNGIDTSAYEESFVHAYEMASDDILASVSRAYEKGVIDKDKYEELSKNINEVVKEREISNLKKEEEKKAKEAAEKEKEMKKPINRIKHKIKKSLKDFGKNKK